MCLAVEEADVIEFDYKYCVYRNRVLNNFYRFLCLPSRLKSW